VDHSGGIQASLAGRYATALFDLARDGKAIDACRPSLAAAEGRACRIGGFPVGADRQSPRSSAAATRRTPSPRSPKALKLDPLTAKFLGVLAENRRLGAALPRSSAPSPR
jgi:F-type H+-transporting ATPase subunit delta